MDKKTTKARIKQIESDLYDFFWIYFDIKTAREMRLHPDRCLPRIKEVVQNTTMSKPKLIVYSGAVKLFLEYQLLKTNLNNL